MLNWRQYNMKSNRGLNKEMTKEENRSSLVVQFWSDKQKINKDSKLNKEIEKICKNINFKK